jgi:hypothetical protein
MEGDMLLHLDRTEAKLTTVEPDFERFSVDLPARIFMIGHRLKIQEVPCTIEDISCSGAKLKVDPALAIPTTFFLNIVGMQEEIGCAIVSREHDHISLKFNILLSEEVLSTILKRHGQMKA